MNIKINSFTFKYLSWLYKWDFDFEDSCPPTSLCDYFWYVVWGYICLPFTIIFYLLEKKFVIGPFIPLLYLMVLMSSVIGMPKEYFNLLLYKDFLTILWDLHFYGIISSTILTIVMVGGVWSFIKLDESIFFKKSGVISNFIKAKKEKICPLITYIDD